MNEVETPIVTSDEISGLRIIAGALIAGVVLFAAIALAFTIGRDPGDPLVGYVALALSAAQIMAWAIVPNIVSKTGWAAASGESARSTEALCGAYRVKMIVGMALLESAAIFDVVAYLVTARWWCLAAAGVLVFLMAASFPTQTKVEHWIETQQQLIESRR